jgi:KUP system potassium uptake protein
VVGTVKLERHLTGDLKPMNKGIRTFIENSVVARIVLKILGVLGVAMVMA